MPLRNSRSTPHKRSVVAPVHRGPQAISAPSAASFPLHAPNAALLIDFDNVTMGIRSDLASELKNLLSSDIVRGKVSVQRAYADWRRYPQYIVPLSESSIDLIFAPAYGSSKKNATDIRLAIDALELVFTRPEIGTFILLSGDSDFSSLVIKLKEYGKYVIGVGIRESSSELLVQNCDEYYSYNALAGLVNIREEEVVKWDPWELTSEAVQRMKRNGDVMRADRLKQVMQQIDSSFDEKNLGMSKFSRFVSDAAHRGILSLNRMENGQFEVDLPKGKVDGSIASAEPAASQLITEATDSTVPVAAEEPRRGRSRRGRGRSRDREDRRPLSGVEAANGDAGTEPGVVVAQPHPELLAEIATPSVRESHSPASSVVDNIGISGMRLTRDEAFTIVRRAVQSATHNGSMARASDVRKAARELLGRDSESLSERNFIRILKDAHDANIVDLRRRGDDYEVASAVEAAPIAEQLSNATAATTPVAVAPVALRGMAPRGVPSRGRGFGAKATTPLPDLLSIGVVEETSSHPVAAHVPESKSVVIQPTVGIDSKRPVRSGAPRKTTVKKTAVKKTVAKTVRKKTA